MADVHRYVGPAFRFWGLGVGCAQVRYIGLSCVKGLGFRRGCAQFLYRLLTYDLSDTLLVEGTHRVRPPPTAPHCSPPSTAHRLSPTTHISNAPRRSDFLAVLFSQDYLGNDLSDILLVADMTSLDVGQVRQGFRVYGLGFMV